MAATSISEITTRRAWQSLGLALSGGGFRATLFHLGTLRALREAGLIGRIKFITAVSGGSILGAHLVQNWAKYTGSEKEFDLAAGELIDFVRRDIRGRIMRRWILSWLVLPTRLSKTTRLTQLLQSQYGRLYRNGSLSDLTPKEGGPPELQILSTSLTTGELCSFDYRGFCDESDIGDGSDGLIPYSNLPLSLAVSASSAFPPLFPPVMLTRDLLHAPNMRHAHALCDGGVYDNLGLRKILNHLSASNKVFDTAVVSDAEGAWGWQTDRTFNFVIPRNARASELLMRRVSALQYELISVFTGHAKVSIDKKLNVATPNVDKLLAAEIQREVPNLRTDLDSFSSAEVNALVRHGYGVTRDLLRGDGIWNESLDVEWRLLKPLRSTTPKAIQEGSRRRWRIWSWFDWASYVTAVACFLYLASPILIYRQLFIERQVAEQQFGVARDSLKKLSTDFPDAKIPRADEHQTTIPNPGIDVTKASVSTTQSLANESTIVKGHAVLMDGFQNYELSTFSFAEASILPWGTRRADIGVANPARNASASASFFLNNDSPPYVPKERQEFSAAAGIVWMPARSLDEVKTAPSYGYEPHYFTPTNDGVYCVKTADGKHFAKIKVTELTPGAIGFDWVYQRSGSQSFE